ncbi:nicotinamide-nucleotide adenylyltransferase [Candidatus Peregrinibacteria bacterium]|jgi:nicotinamide-nucleotide adenylyltransferase|nr:nicotinamide-nucleotide adenylyltransferase [Candidatus Peregrinibacteria bacterium]MBT7737042.1 nicotinamide-nucleotide adenylyltransferase [Candidatus Peregrinibacteria bacterium]
MQSALFIGRFQPFHNGHLDIVKKILEDNQRVILAVGSAEKNYLSSNPLTAGERFRVIDESLREAGISSERYAIVPVRNVNNYALWVNHINIYVPPYTRIYTGSPIVKACYEGKYQRPDGTCKTGPEVIQVEKELEVSATKVRESILNKDDWESLVPKAAAKVLKEMELPKRLQTIKDTMDVTKYNNSY